MQHLVQSQAAIDEILQLACLAGLAEILVGVRHEAHHLLQFGVAGQDDSNRIGPPITHNTQQLRTVHSGHAHIGDDHVEMGALERFNGQGTTFDELHVPLRAQPVEPHP